MLKRTYLATILILLFVTGLQAQEKQKKVYRPDIPGFFLIDFGLNTAIGQPANFTQGFWGSRTLNLYYHYPIQLFNSKFSFNPGAGFAFERFKLTNNYTLTNTPSLSDGTFQLVAATDILTSRASVTKSMLVSNYFDVMPIEVRFDSNPKDPGRGLNASVGARVGLLLESHTKIEYTDGGNSVTYKDKQSHGLNSVRYGVYSRLGIGNFNLFMYYNLSPYFASGKGPHNSGTDQTSTTMNTMTMGISLTGF
jgi:hypothetical protein